VGFGKTGGASLRDANGTSALAGVRRLGLVLAGVRRLGFVLAGVRRLDLVALNPEPVRLVDV
jgi:hypothetical protein